MNQYRTGVSSLPNIILMEGVMPLGKQKKVQVVVQTTDSGSPVPAKKEKLSIISDNAP